MTTRLPTRDQLLSILESVRAEPEGPDQAAAIERLEAQLAELDDPGADTLTGPDMDLVEPDPEATTPTPVAPTAPAAKPFGAQPKVGDEPTEKPDNKPF